MAPQMGKYTIYFSKELYKLLVFCLLQFWSRLVGKGEKLERDLLLMIDHSKKKLAYLSCFESNFKS
jgi:hypothetical protein